MATLGKHGLRRVAELCYHKAHYAAQRVAELRGYELPLSGDFFHEFVVRCPGSVSDLLQRLEQRGLIAGYDVSEKIDRGLLVCVTEMNSRSEIDRLIEALGKGRD
jgi:glycine dehydrogenase subunit 1